MAYSPDMSMLVTLTAFAVALIAAAVGAYSAFSSAQRQLRRDSELKESVARAEEAAAKEPEKTKPLWDLSRKTFELYVNRNLGQVGRIFWITVAVMTAGFILVCYGVVRSFDARLEVAILTAAAGVVTQAIGATFMLIYRSTMDQASNYMGMLERINSVGMAMSIVDAISTDAEKNAARVELVKQVLAIVTKQQAKS